MGKLRILKNRLLHKEKYQELSYDPYEQNTRRITEENITELSQFQVGDTVTLSNTIINDEDIFKVGRTLKVKKIIARPLKLPEKSFQEFKSEYKINEKIFTLFLVDNETGVAVKCNASDVVKGEVPKSELRAIINNRRRKNRYDLILTIMSFILIFSGICTANYSQNELFGDLLSLGALICIFPVFIKEINKCRPFKQIKSKKSKQ